MPRLLRKPKWSWAAVKPVHPLLPALIIGFVGWELRGFKVDGSLRMLQPDDFKFLGIFAGVIVVSYVLARSGYLYMQVATTTRLRRIWTGVMLFGLIAMIASLVIHIWMPLYSLTSMYAWALWSVLLLLFEGRGYRPSMLSKRLVDKVEELLDVEIDGHARGPFVEEFDDEVEEELDDEPDQLPVRQTAFERPEGASSPELSLPESLFGPQRLAPQREETTAQRRYREQRSGSGVRH